MQLYLVTVISYVSTDHNVKKKEHIATEKIKGKYDHMSAIDYMGSPDLKHILEKCDICRYTYEHTFA